MIQRVGQRGHGRPIWAKVLQMFGHISQKVAPAVAVNLVKSVPRGAYFEESCSCRGSDWTLRKTSKVIKVVYKVPLGGPYILLINHGETCETKVLPQQRQV